MWKSGRPAVCDRREGAPPTGFAGCSLLCGRLDLGAMFSSLKAL